MGLIQLKSDLTKYKPTEFRGEDKITLGNTKLTNIENNKINSTDIDLTNIKSKLAPNYNSLYSSKSDKDSYNIPDYELSKNWMKQKEIFNYKSIFSIGSDTNKDKSTENSLSTNKRLDSKTIDINPIRTRNNQGVTFLNSKYDVKLITKQLQSITSNKKSTIDIKKVEYDINDYKSDIKLNDIRDTSVLQSSIINRKFDYANMKLINYNEQSPKSILNRDRIVIATPKISSGNNIDSKAFNDVRFKPLMADGVYKNYKVNLTTLSNVDLTDDKFYNSGYDDINKNVVLSKKVDVKRLPKLSSYTNTPNNEVIPRDINGNQKFIDLTKLDSVYDELKGKLNRGDLTNKRYFNSDYDIEVIKGVNYFDDKFQTNFNVNQSLSSTNFKFKFQSKFGFDKIPNIDGFKLRIKPLISEYNFNNSEYSNKSSRGSDGFTSNAFKDTNAFGFTLKQKDTMYLFDSSDYRWKQNAIIPNVNFIDISNEFSNQFTLKQKNTLYNFESTQFNWKDNKIPSVNYIDTKNQYQVGFNLNPEHFISKYVSNSSKFVWKDDKINAVNYLDIKNKYQEGLVLRPKSLETKFRNDVSDLVWKNDLVNNVNHIDTNNFYQRGFVLKTQPFKSYYRNDISRFDFDGISSDAPVTDYFDRNKQHSQVGFNKFTLPLNSDYIKDSSLYDFDGDSSKAPVTDYFDRLKTNTKLGFRKFTIHHESDYVKDSSLYDYNGTSQSGPAVNYLDMGNKYHRGFNKFPISKLTHYVNNVSEFVWKGTSIPSMNFIDVKRFNTKTGFKLRVKHHESDYNNDSTVLRWKGNKAPSMNFFKDTNQVNFTQKQRLHDSKYKSQSSKLTWVNNKVPLTNYFDVSYKNQLGFTRAVKLGTTEYKIESSQYSFRDNFNNYFTPNEVDGFTLKFTDVSNTKFKVGLSSYDDIDKSKYSDVVKYATSHIDTSFSNFKTEEKYLSIFKRESQLFVSDFKKKDSEVGIDYFTNATPGSNGFFTKRIDKLNTDFSLVDVIKKNDFFLSPIPYDNNNRYEITGGSDYNLSPKFNTNYKKIYTKLGNIRDLAYNSDIFWNEPYIIRGLNNPDALGPQKYGVFGASYDEGMIRGGLLTYAARVYDDIQRVGKALTSGKGLMFMLRQFLLQKTNPNVEIYPKPSTGSGIADTVIGAVGEYLFGRPTQFFNPLNTALSAKGMTGPLFRRHSLDVLSGDDIVLGRYGRIAHTRNQNSNTRELLSDVTTPTLLDREGTDNRLLQLTKELFPDWLNEDFQNAGVLNMFSVNTGTPIVRLSGISGPNSFFGIGTTVHRRYEVTNRLYSDTKITTSGVSTISLHRFTSDRQYASGENKNQHPNSLRTKLNDNSVGDRYTLNNRVVNDLETLTSIIKDLETFGKSTENFVVSETYNTILNPFRTFGGVLGGTSLNDHKEYEILQKNAKERRDKRSNVRSTGSLVGMVSGSDFTPTALYSDYNSSKNYLGDDKNVNGTSISMTYTDMQFLAKELRDDRAKYARRIQPGGFSLLKQLRGKAHIKDTYQGRLQYINQLISDDGSDQSTNNTLSVAYSTGRQGSSEDNIGLDVVRNKPYWFSFPDDGLSTPKNKKDWDLTLMDSRGDKINLIDVITNANVTDYTTDNFLTLKDANENVVRDFVPLMFTTANYNQLNPPTAKSAVDFTALIFRCTMEGLTDTFNASWAPSKVMGRGDEVFMYEGYSRSTSLDFKVVATTLEEQFTNWRKLNELASMTAPDYGPTGTSRMTGPVMRLTLGDIYIGVPILIESVSYTFDFTNGFELAGFDDKGKNVAETKSVLRLPSIIDVSVSVIVIGNYRPEKGGRMYELKNQHNKTWYRKEAIKPTKEEQELANKRGKDEEDKP